MARPLTKPGDKGPLIRPAVIEAQIDEAIALVLPALRARLVVTDHQHPLHLRSETLVHLVRHGRRIGDQALIGAALPVLLGRCEANLFVKVPDGQLPEAASVREEILGKFSELFASDGHGAAPDELDFYECKFNRAFRFFRIDVVRQEIARLKPMVDVPQSTEEGDDDAQEDVFARVSEAFQSPATQEGIVFRSELEDAIQALHPDERDAVILVHALGYKEESDDPDEETAATRCNCTGRTIRNRLTRAAVKLSRFKEDL